MTKTDNTILTELLLDQTLNGVGLGSTRNEVLGLLGIPGHWSGKGQLDKHESVNWNYGSCQINFDEIGKVSALGFFPSYEFPPEENAEVSSSLHQCLNGTLSYVSFLNMLDDLRIEHRPFEDASFMKILIGKTQVSFSKGLNVEASRRAGERIEQEYFMMSAIRIGNTIGLGHS